MLGFFYKIDYVMFKKIQTFIWKKPKIKKKDPTFYKNSFCTGVYFRWKVGMWFIKTSCGEDISVGLYEKLLHNEIFFPLKKRATKK
jgi:hypothetical protein